MFRNFTQITVIGKDKKGVIAGFTTFLFNNGANIEDLDQNVIKGMFSMTLHADTSSMKLSREEFKQKIEELASSLKMEVRIRFPGKKEKPSMAILVTKEEHCLEKLIEGWKKNEINVDIRCIIGNRDDLKHIADRENIPFFKYGLADQRENETNILAKLDEIGIDFIVLARYMKILSPDFVWRYENRIINIHPSLLPAFPGAQAYRQAVEKGVKIIGVTAHFVTMDLDQGPIISQDCFKVPANLTLKEIVKKGQEIESKTLFKAVKKFLKGNLSVHWGKVYEM